ncbi:nucleoside 2-deoxyribosyltransferase [Rossellomorea aquimaris]|uniref:nucleoside 2-deoxyribosyltransferase n=1 Tax=Rossellomorea aquimaris TaxID=189382 RepID=UPI001CD246EF|nr:nucleoside 2-deoxyribosyltransferase [Rossellomorea aquimaris]MCA1054062.1 nucleoside 2-deoxyribosyltransferase [Rossellomorea aquimaris]
MKSFYIASSFSNKEAVRYVRDQLTQKGFVHTYDWTINERAATMEELEKIGQQERKAVMEADVVIVLLPAGKGSHIEFGIALGFGKTIYLHSPDERINQFETTTTFYHVPEVVKCIGSIDELIESVVTGTN